MDPELLRALRAAGLITEQQQMAYLNSIMPPSDPYMNMGMGMYPADVEGMEDSLGFANDWVDYNRDLNTLGADFMSATMAGPGAYDRSAFDPIITRRKVDAPPNYSLLASGLQSKSPLEKWVAQMAAEGLSSVGIRAELEDAALLAANEESTGDELADAAGPELLQRGKIDRDTKATYYDFDDVLTYADQLATQVGKLPAGAVTQDPKTGEWTINAPMPLHDPVTGEYYYEEEEESPLTKEFRKRGLYSPFDEYELADFSAEGGAYAQRAADATAQAQALRAAAPTDLDSRVEEAYARMLTQREAADADRMARSLTRPVVYDDMQNLTPYDGPELRLGQEAPTAAGSPFVRPGDRPMIGPPGPINRGAGRNPTRGRVPPEPSLMETGVRTLAGRGLASLGRAVTPEPEEGQPGGAWRVFGDEASGIRDALGNVADPFQWFGKSAVNVAAGDESPFQGEAWSPWGGGGRGGGAATGDRVGSSRSDPMPQMAPDFRAQWAKKKWQEELGRRSEVNLPIALLERDARMDANKAAGRYQFDFQRPEAQKIAQANLDFQLARAMGRTPLQDQQALRRSMGQYGLGF